MSQARESGASAKRIPLLLAKAGSAAEGAARTHFGGCVPAVTLGDRQGRLEKK